MSDERDPDTRDVALPADVVERIERRLSHTRHESVDDYAAVALDLLLRQLARDEEYPDESADELADGKIEDADAVEDRLESLGYL